MASSYADQGLVALLSDSLGVAGKPIPGVADLIALPFAPAPALKYADLAWEAVHKVNVTPLWNVTLQAVAHKATAVATCTYVFDGTFAGQVFYGIGLHDVGNTTLFYSETFPVPYQVPTGGGTLQWTFNLYFGDCAYNCGGV